MPEVEESVMIMEKSPSYFDFPSADVPELIKSRVSNAKLLVILCDPARRVISDYKQEVSSAPQTFALDFCSLSISRDSRDFCVLQCFVRCAELIPFV